MPGGLDSGCRRERGQRVAHERVAREAGHLEARSRCDRDPVAEVDSLQDGHDVVLAVVAKRPHDERKIDLRRSGRSVHRALVRATNSVGSSASARVSGGTADRLERGGSPLSVREPCERDRVRQRLAAVRESGLDDGLDAEEVIGQLGPPEGDERRVDVRRRPEDRAGDGVETGSVGGQLHQHGDGAVCLRGR